MDNRGYVMDLRYNKRIFNSRREAYLYLFDKDIIDVSLTTFLKRLTQHKYLKDVIKQCKKKGQVTFRGEMFTLKKEVLEVYCLSPHRYCTATKRYKNKLSFEEIIEYLLQNSTVEERMKRDNKRINLIYDLMIVKQLPSTIFLRENKIS